MSIEADDDLTADDLAELEALEKQIDAESAAEELEFDKEESPDDMPQFRVKLEITTALLADLESIGLDDDEILAMCTGNFDEVDAEHIADLIENAEPIKEKQL